MRLLTWFYFGVTGAWQALRYWWRQCRAEDAAQALGDMVPPPQHTATATVSGKRAGGAIVKRNRGTVWFQLHDGRIIKRHIRKHFVVETAW